MLKDETWNEKELKKEKKKKKQVSPSEPCKPGLNSQTCNPLNYWSELNSGA
jgi:hypothetical protein